MTRIARVKSRSGTYHIMLRGINRQTIFEEDEDKLRLLSTLRRYKRKSKIQIYSYCLMDNHIHLLVKENDEPVSIFIQRISASYVYWYNNKYERCGHLFQDRFKSENVETKEYFLTVLRYIHRNPIKAGLENDVFKCKWTSIGQYYSYADIVDVDLAFKLFSPVRSKAIQMFGEFMQVVNDDECLDNFIKIRLPDNTVRSYLRDMGISNSSILQQMEKEERDQIVFELKKLDGISIRQLSRITGISKSVIARVGQRDRSIVPKNEEKK